MCNSSQNRIYPKDQDIVNKHGYPDLFPKASEVFEGAKKDGRLPEKAEHVERERRLKIWIQSRKQKKEAGG